MVLEVTGQPLPYRGLKICRRTPQRGSGLLGDGLRRPVALGCDAQRRHQFGEGAGVVLSWD